MWFLNKRKADLLDSTFLNDEWMPPQLRMDISVTSWGDNPQQPFAGEHTYLPDQLIAGNKHLVTANGTITGGALYKRGTVMGVASVAAAAGTPVAASGNTGNATISAVVLGTRAKVGTYTLHFTAAQTFNVIDPDGLELAPKSEAGSPYNYSSHPTEPEIAFTFTAGGTAMVAGDNIAIPVAAGTGKYTKCVATVDDGSQNPTAILADDADTTSGDVNGGLYLEGEFNQNAVILDSSLTIAGVRAPLRVLGIHLKPVVSAADPT